MNCRGVIRILRIHPLDLYLDTWLYLLLLYFTPFADVSPSPEFTSGTLCFNFILHIPLLLKHTTHLETHTS